MNKIRARMFDSIIWMYIKDIITYEEKSKLLKAVEKHFTNHDKDEKYKHTFGCDKCNFVFVRDSKTLENSKVIKCGECKSTKIKFLQSKKVSL